MFKGGSMIYTPENLAPKNRGIVWFNYMLSNWITDTLEGMILLTKPSFWGVKSSEAI